MREDDPRERQLLNDVSAYIDAPDVEELTAGWHPAVFREVALYAWSHIACIQRRLAVLTRARRRLDG